MTRMEMIPIQKRRKKLKAMELKKIQKRSPFQKAKKQPRMTRMEMTPIQKRRKQQKAMELKKIQIHQRIVKKIML